jgi:hypothetical protein
LPSFLNCECKVNAFSSTDKIIRGFFLKKNENELEMNWKEATDNYGSHESKQKTIDLMIMPDMDNYLAMLCFAWPSRTRSPTHLSCGVSNRSRDSERHRG